MSTEMTVQTADPKESQKFAIDEIVFAKQRGNIPWPARIIEYNREKKKYNVNFFATNRRALIREKKIWSYESHKQEFITMQNLESEFFYNAITLVEDAIIEYKEARYAKQLLKQPNFKVPLEINSDEFMTQIASAIRAISETPLNAPNRAECEERFINAIKYQALVVANEEKRFVSYERDMRLCFSHRHADTDTGSMLMYQMCRIRHTALLLLRNVDVVETIENLTYYYDISFTRIGGRYIINEPILSQIVRSLAIEIYTSFKKQFPGYHLIGDFLKALKCLKEILMRHPIFVPMRDPFNNNEIDESNVNYEDYYPSGLKTIENDGIRVIEVNIEPDINDNNISREIVNNFYENSRNTPQTIFGNVNQYEDINGNINYDDNDFDISNSEDENAPYERIEDDISLSDDDMSEVYMN